MVERPITVLMLVILLTLDTIAQEKTFLNETAWSWYVHPKAAKKGVILAHDSLIVMLRETGSRGIHAVLVCFDDFKDVYNLKAVAFDDEMKRYPFSGWGSACSNGVWVRSFLLSNDQLSWNKLRFVGIEQITEKDHRAFVIPAAINQLKLAGVDRLPYTDIGNSYPFDLETLEGGKLTSQNLLGKVVLLDFWASWCAPCMQLIPELKEIFKEYRKRGFVVIGVNLDNSLEKAREITFKEKLPWPVVLAPLDKQHRELWRIAAGIQGIPRLLIIDRKGILRADVSPSEVRAEIHRLVNE